MLVRFGYVAMSVNVANASPSKTMTATQFAKLADREAALRKLERIAEENIHNTLRLLKHNRAHDIHVFRFSSKLIPLLTHPATEGWDPFPHLSPSFTELGDYAIKHAMRTSFHPDHFTVLTTPREEVLRASLFDLSQQTRMLEAMGLDDRSKCNIHIGGTYGDKVTALARFRSRFPELPSAVRSRLTLENDDKTYTALETLQFAEELGVPMVLDLHHHQVNPGEGEPPEELWPRVQRTWEGTSLPPKIHVSSPRSERDIRAHADYVEPAPLLHFLHSIAGFAPQLDIMIEAKQKDAALFKLVDDLAREKGIRRIDGATLEVVRRI
ncbi:UV DNA damage repair endonuclease UvsE [Gorillibacterium timonense]|uniref:UV DNA damage repair endonuclease UvsE n=1 Tax=Gorillibacterium timonense TaxID=1689269 RepID=UPI00071E0948|nr:UV DNA damage repair endonuclease UvsE [Gorillibacterium timonense]